ncbi:hypothetical protein [Breoghania sp.]|uniref:hypothetical protein n=1 Tax=Breoghania sp. TaxID=2065378 RepID=UPI00260E0F5A|nr:hypothetical protein [Breoghania sp.]MDJ0932056.1 hypothetical protein [Breoghania sp.]
MPEQIKDLAGLLEDTGNYPLFVHCEFSNRVGAMWALYRAASGVPAEIAVQEGWTVGMRTSREAAVHEQLGLPPL